MFDNRLTFTTPTNITLPIVIYSTLVEDAFHFGFTKNKQANISGLLNHLIPQLADYREELHGNLLQANDNDEKLTTKIEENLYKIYFNKYDYCDDGVVVVPLRINNEHMQDFLDIVDRKLLKFNMDFSGFVRSLLIEYTSKRLNQREYFFFFREINKIKKAISSNNFCLFYTADEKCGFVPVSIEIMKDTEYNLVVGIDTIKGISYVIPLHQIKRVVVTEEEFTIEQEDCDFIYDSLEKYYKEMEN